MTPCYLVVMTPVVIVVGACIAIAAAGAMGIWVGLRSHGPTQSAILRKIRRQRRVNRAYANGYDQGRFDERMEIACNGLPCPCHPDCQECNAGAQEAS
jgi:hypothetical protein